MIFTNYMSRESLTLKLKIIMDYFDEQESDIFVQNMTDTTKENDEVWIDWWKDKMKWKKENTIKCANLNCNKKAIHGAHVKIVMSDFPYLNDDHANRFIIPFCAECNNPNQTDPFEINVKDLVPLILKDIEEINDIENDF